MTSQPAALLAEQAAALSKAVVGVVARSTGRGPTKVRTTIGPDLICVVLRDNHTKGERTLLARGEHALVGTLRRAYHGAMSPSLIQAVQEMTGRDVQTLLADHDPALDVSVLNFVLRPLPANVSPAVSDAREESGCAQGTPTVTAG